MDLAAKVEAYLAAEFPACCTPPADGAPPVDGVVVDVMVLLHAFAVKPGQEYPALHLVQSVWYAIAETRHIALCFDVSESTPAAKAIEWANRPAPAVVVTAQDVLAALGENDLPHFPSLTASREARSTLCKWSVQRLAERLSDAQTMLVLDDGVPTVYRRAGIEVRPDFSAWAISFTASSHGAPTRA